MFLETSGKWMMRFLLLPFLFAAFTYALDPGSIDITNGGNVCETAPGTDLVTLTYIDIYPITYADNIKGLDGANGTLLFAVNEYGNKRVVAASCNDLSFISEYPLPSDHHPFGVAYVSGDIHVNDYSSTSIYHGVDFSESFPNPYDDDGRGMDFDGTYIWEAYGFPGSSSGAVCRFLPDGTGFEGWDLPGINTQLSGMTLYPLAGSTGVAVTAYEIGQSSHHIWFYEFTGSEMVLLGSATLPAFYVTTGLTYSSYTGTFFIAYMLTAGEDWHVIEFTIDFTSLEQQSWGAIKTLL
jgi:hypothetical protein